MKLHDVVIGMFAILLIGWILLLLLVALGVTGCAAIKTMQPGYNTELLFEQRHGYDIPYNDRFADHYSFTSKTKTPLGIPYQGGDPIAIDAKVKPTLECLGKLDWIGRFNVLIAQDAKPSCHGEDQVLPVRAYTEAYIQKMGGDAGDPMCTPHWRDGIVGPESQPTAIATPRMSTLNAAVARIIFDVADPWHQPWTKCLQ